MSLLSGNMFGRLFKSSAISFKAGLGGKSVRQSSVMKGIGLASMGFLGTTAVLKSINRSKRRNMQQKQTYNNTIMRNRMGR